VKNIFVLTFVCISGFLLADPSHYSQPYAPYYSQCGQDKYLNETIFKGKKNGVFVEIGAHDGISYSNSYYFEKYLNWTGICIEPHPQRFQELKENRTCHCYQGCVSDTKGIAQFLMVMGYPEMLSGLIDKYDKRHLARISKEIKQRGGSKQLIEVKCIQFNELMKKYNTNSVDFVSIDTEGGEEEILKSIDFEDLYQGNCC